jgi:hypothetical protein
MHLTFMVKPLPDALFVSSFVCLVYYMPSVPAHAQYAKELHERIRREFPEVRTLYILICYMFISFPQLRVYKFWDRPVGMYNVSFSGAAI